jgi:hypothetical protein
VEFALSSIAKESLYIPNGVFMMSPYKQKFKKEYSFELLRIAIGDLESAKVLFEINKGRPENIIYHIEQSIEKSLLRSLIT